MHLLLKTRIWFIFSLGPSRLESSGNREETGKWEKVGKHDTWGANLKKNKQEVNKTKTQNMTGIFLLDG